MTLLIVWRENYHEPPLSTTTDPDEIAAIFRGVGCRYERHRAADSLPADADTATVLDAYQDLVQKVVNDEGCATVDVATIQPTGDAQWPERAREMRAKFIDEHTHGDDSEVRFMTRGAGVFYLHIDGKVHAIYCEPGDLTALPQGTLHWFDTGRAPDFTAIRFFRNPQGWAGVPSGNGISRGFPDFDFMRTRARELSA